MLGDSREQIVSDFEQWWEWHRRVFAEGEDPNWVSWTMLGIIDRAMERVNEAFWRTVSGGSFNYSSARADAEMFRRRVLGTLDEPSSA